MDIPEDKTKTQMVEAEKAQSHEVTCPKCGHKFWHKIGDAIKGAAEGIGTAIGETKFGGDS